MGARIVASDEIPKAHGFIRKHWLGEYSFPRSFWLHTVLLAYLVPILALALLSFNGWHIPARVDSVAFVAVLLMFYPSLLWGMLGTARAGRLYSERGGRKIWVSAAPWATTLLLMDSIYFFLGLRGTVVEHMHLALTGKYGPPASISVIKNGTALLIAGELREGSAEVLASAMTRFPAVTSITLDSKGGLLKKANLLAKSISQYHLDTYVQGECSSACTFVFLAGRRRCVAGGARIGFHAASYVRDLSRRTSRSLADYERHLYVRAGLPEAFINTVMETPNRRVWYPSRQELLDAHVTTPGCP